MHEAFPGLAEPQVPSQTAQQSFLFSLSFLTIIYFLLREFADERHRSLPLSLHLLPSHVTEHSLHRVKLFSPQGSWVSSAPRGQAAPLTPAPCWPWGGVPGRSSR